MCGVGEGQVEFENRIVLYMDALGTKAIYEDRDANGIRSLIELAKLFVSKCKSEAGIEISAFSDHLVISKMSKENFKEDKKVVDGFIDSVAYVFKEGLKKGILFRGAIGKGKLLHKGVLIGGQALNDAYVLENKEAIYPRVIVSKEISDIYNNLKPEESFIEQDVDGKYYVNCLINMCFMPAGSTDNECINFLEIARVNIIHNLKKYKEINFVVFRKWLWFAEKFISALVYWKSYDQLNTRTAVLESIDGAMEEIKKILAEMVTSDLLIYGPS